MWCQVILRMFCRREPPPRWNVPPRFTHIVFVIVAFLKGFKYCRSFEILSCFSTSPQYVLFALHVQLFVHIHLFSSCSVHSSSLHIFPTDLKNPFSCPRVSVAAKLKPWASAAVSPIALSGEDVSCDPSWLPISMTIWPCDWLAASLNVRWSITKLSLFKKRALLTLLSFSVIS